MLWRRWRRSSPRFVVSKLLYLGAPSPVVTWLREQGEDVTQMEQRLVVEDVAGYDWLVSYNYHYLVTPDVLEHFAPLRRLNLHISYLPWNRGADPNFWSWVDNTPKGITIHSLDAGVDTGPWLIRQQVDLVETHTLRTSYAALHEIMQRAFMAHWPALKAEQVPLHPQEVGGSYHRRADAAPYRPYLTSLGYDLPVTEVQRWVRETREAYA